MTCSSILRRRLIGLVVVLATWIPTTVAKVDYIIVGGGPAGYVTAELLSRNVNVTVTLLEAGADNDDSVDVNTPAYSPLNPDKAFFYYSESDPDLGGLSPNVAQGKGLGGGTAINAMGYCRGAASVFDEWATISGNPGLAWDSLLEEFKATTHYTYQQADYEQYVNESVFGDGPLEVTRSSFLTGLEIPFTTALKSILGLPDVSTVDGTGIGVDLSLGTIRSSNRTRTYARNTFGHLVESRPNVQVLTNSWVSKINFDGTTAIGVSYVNTLSNASVTLEAAEVILAGGALNSPKLLMQSGVGPASVLSSLDIDIVADIPQIGQNLWDHHYSYIEFQVPDNICTWWQIMTNVTEIADSVVQYNNHSGAGPLGSNNGEAYGATRLPDSIFGPGVNSSHYTSLPADRPYVLYEFSTVPFRQPAPNISIAAVWVALVQPEASGYLTINSSSYQDPPLMHSNYYGSPADKAVVLAGYKQLRQILSSTSMQEHYIQEVWPGSNVTTDDQLWAAIQQSASSFHHPMGTIALGSVVGPDWRIKGLDGIRVVDSSTLPYMPTCHPQASVYAVAHRAARDIIRDDAIEC